MSKNNKICITFAGAVGSSKTPIANYLSTKLQLPIFSNDAVRSETIEDFGSLDQTEYIKRRNQRLTEIAKNKVSFIYDASVDREWSRLKERLEAGGYKWFIISIDLSRNFLEKLYQRKKYLEPLKQIDKLINDHDVFLEKYGNDVAMHITEKDFDKRLKISYQKALHWIKKTRTN